MFIQSLSLASVHPFSPHFPKCLGEFVCVVHKCKHTVEYTRMHTVMHRQVHTHTNTNTWAQHHIAGVKQQQMSLEFALTCQGNLGHGLTLRCPIRNALFSHTHLADINAVPFGPLIRESYTLTVCQSTCWELRWALPRLHQWKENQCQTN